MKEASCHSSRVIQVYQKRKGKKGMEEKTENKEGYTYPTGKRKWEGDEEKTGWYQLLG